MTPRPCLLVLTLTLSCLLGCSGADPVVYQRWVYLSFSRSDPTRKVELFFRKGEVVTIRN